jgi:hypothetical protein
MLGSSLFRWCLVFLVWNFVTTDSMANLSATGWERGLTEVLSRRSMLWNRPKSWDRQLTQVYHDADLNRDGSITFDECYERLLRFYIKLNQQAPIPPPDRADVLQLYKRADWNHNRRLNLEEFKQLAIVLIERAYLRLLVHKFVTILIGPFLATTLVYEVSTRAAFQPFRTAVATFLNEQVFIPNALATTLQSAHFWKTVVLIFTVSHLGNMVLHVANAFFFTTPTKPKSILPK